MLVSVANRFWGQSTSPDGNVSCYHVFQDMEQSVGQAFVIFYIKFSSSWSMDGSNDQLVTRVRRLNSFHLQKIHS